MFFELFDEDTAGLRPALLHEVAGPQARDQQCTKELLADVVPMVQILDVPVPQPVDQLVAVLTHFDFLIPEQVLKVPKISLPSRPSRKFLTETQMAEWWK